MLARQLLETRSPSEHKKNARDPEDGSEKHAIAPKQVHQLGATARVGPSERRLRYVAPGKVSRKPFCPPPATNGRTDFSS